MLQGMALSKYLPGGSNSPDGMCHGYDLNKSARICLMTRKSQRNPGVRYYARGLNEMGGN